MNHRFLIELSITDTWKRGEKKYTSAKRRAPVARRIFNSDRGRTPVDAGGRREVTGGSKTARETARGSSNYLLVCQVSLAALSARGGGPFQ